MFAEAKGRHCMPSSVFYLSLPYVLRRVSHWNRVPLFDWSSQPACSGSHMLDREVGHHVTQHLVGFWGVWSLLFTSDVAYTLFTKLSPQPHLLFQFPWVEKKTVNKNKTRILKFIFSSTPTLSPLIQCSKYPKAEVSHRACVSFCVSHKSLIWKYDMVKWQKESRTHLVHLILAHFQWETFAVWAIKQQTNQ